MERGKRNSPRPYLDYTRSRDPQGAKSDTNYEFVCEPKGSLKTTNYNPGLRNIDSLYQNVSE